MSLLLPPPPTNLGLLPDARHLVLPAGIVSSGFPAVERTCAEIGVLFDPWQTDLNRCILAKDSSGDYAADTIVMSIPRQVGKTFDVGGIVFADSIVHPRTTTVWTAHRFKVARESFNELRAWARSSKLAPHIDYDNITTAAGNECIPFRNGSRILFAARERGAIRGFTKVRRLVLDEGQILTSAALADMAPTMNHALNPQIIIMGTPPKPNDPSEVFDNLREEALDGTSEGVLYVEFSADETADLDDREQWRKANPSYPRRTSEKAIRRMRKLLGDEDFRREGLGIWSSDDQKAAIDQAKWVDLEHQEEARPSPVAFAVEVSEDRQWTSIGLAGQRSDGRRHIQIVQSGRGTGWVAERLVELVAKWKPTATAIDLSGPSGSLLPDLEAAGVEVTSLTGQKVAAAHGAVFDAIEEGTVRHSSQPALNIAVRAARKHPRGDSWVFRSNEPSTDIGPLRAVAMALYVLSKGGKPRSGTVIGVS